jgi:hypothetical protein
LLGFEFFNHETIISYTFKKNKLLLNRKYGLKYKINEIDFSEDTCNSYLSISKPEPMLNKVQNVQKLFGVKFNSEAHKDHKEKPCDLILTFQDVFGENTEKLGNFPIKAPILTKENKSVYVKQHPIAAAYKGKVEAEISKMLKMGVIEKCDNPKGWNRPIICVPKKDGSVRVCANFKRTINTVMSENCDKF